MTKCESNLVYTDEDNMIDLECMGGEDHLEYQNHYALVRYDGRLIEISWRTSSE